MAHRYVVEQVPLGVVEAARLAEALDRGASKGYRLASTFSSEVWWDRHDVFLIWEVPA